MVFAHVEDMLTSTRLRFLRPATLALIVAAMSVTNAQGPAATPSPSQPGAAPSVTALTDGGWPRDIVSGRTTITIYQPQVDMWNGITLTGRAAVAVKEASAKVPEYGIVRFTAQTHVDKDARLVTLERFTVTHATFAKGDKGQQWTSLIEARAVTLQPIALDRLEAAKEIGVEQHRAESVPVRNDAPKMIFSSVPAMLLPVDGPPAYQEVPGTALSRVFNTRPLILRDKAGTHYLKIFDGWMQAPSVTGPYVVSAAPADSDKALKYVIATKTADLLVGGDAADPSARPSLAKGPVPQIFVETTPAELIVTEGQPKYTAIEGTALLYAENTTGNIFIDTKDQHAYVLVSGRWFSGASSLSGEWTFIPGDRLPEDFKKIPDTSPKENVKASIPGTPQAEEALIANTIPQTAKVNRRTAKFAPTFDGTPKLEPIAGTELRYVVNTSLPILLVNNADYYGLQNGVWFVSTTLTGPWLVATAVPAPIYSIPPSSPLHYVTYVHVYDFTPEYVIVGYTPGYYGAFVSNGVVVYGTGYVYSPWIGTMWYGPPVTYGFGATVTYTPWAGWAIGFGMGWAWGAVTTSVGWGWGPYPWWGPAGWAWAGAYPWVYSPVYGAAWGPRGAVAWGPGYWSGTTGNVYSRWGATTAVTRTTGGFDAWTGNRWTGQTGMAYNSRTGTLAAGQRAAVGNAYTGNYAAGARGATYNARTGVATRGSTVTTGNVFTGGEVTTGKGVVTGPGGNSAAVAGFAGSGGNRGGVVVGPNNTYAGVDGNVYRHNDDGSWQQHVGGGWQSANVSPSDRLLRDSNARAAGEDRWSRFRSGGFRSAGGGLGARPGLGRRR